MRRRHFFCLVLLGSVTACQDVPLTPSAPDITPRFALAAGGTDLRSGYGYICSLRDGEVVCLGEGDEGQPIGVHRASNGTIVQLTTGGTHACGLRDDGAVECWGANDFGETLSLKRAAVGSFTSVSAGGGHTCALRTDGLVECWGFNGSGQAPPLVAARTGRFTEVSAGANSTCALRDDGAIECWGYYKSAPPLRTAPSGTYVKLGQSVGASNCALTSTGVADCWGHLEGWHAGPYVQVVGGAAQVCALRDSGIADCWGYPPSWEGPGDGTLTRGIALPTPAAKWSRITAGNYHACGLRADGYFECFGLQVMGSDAPDVVPVADTPTATLSKSRIRVAWRDLNSNELRTEIERGVGDGTVEPTSWTRVGSVGANLTSFSDGTAPAGATYVYRVRTCNNAGCSAWDPSKPVRFQALPPSPSGRQPAARPGPRLM
ncbi:MAG TPA: hypothetical protein VFQ39_02565 [Longimicrobium sp.]|nr:hypothetical protein [Longimicrobium sp.]